jgi:hypothetical protein
MTYLDFTGSPPSTSEFFWDSISVKNWQHKDYRNIGGTLVGFGSPSSQWHKAVKKISPIKEAQKKVRETKMPWPLSTLRLYTKFNKNIAVLVENAEAAGVENKEFSPEYFLSIA